MIIEIVYNIGINRGGSDWWMKWLDNLFLTDDEIRTLAIFLAYGVGLGVMAGLIFNNVEMGFALGGVISIVVSLFKVYIERIKKSNRIHINKL